MRAKLELYQLFLANLLEIRHDANNKDSRDALLFVSILAFE